MSILVENMKVNDLYIGDVEGKNEFSNNVEKIEEIFLKLDHLEENFIDRSQYFIFGHKGTGKTSLLKYIEYKVKELKDDAIMILFKDIKQDPLTYTQFKKLLSNSNDKDMATMTFWQWFLLSYLVNSIFPLYPKKTDLIFNSKDSKFKTLSKFLLKLIGNTNVNFSSDNVDIETSIPDMTSDQEIDEIIESAQKMKKLEDYIKVNLNKKIYILIDELETSTLSSSFNEDTILIKSLILCVEKLNKVSPYLTLVVAVRTEILNNIFTSGAEINKLLESKGEETKWTYDNYGEEHPLIKMMIKKFRYSMKKYAPDQIENIDNASDSEIFKRWFPVKLMNDDDGNNAKFILHNTWNKPRDLVRFLQIMQDKAKQKNYFERIDYDQSVKEYSTKAWDELKEELISILDGEEIRCIEIALSNFSKLFKYEQLIKRFTSQTKLDEYRIKEIIRIMYDVGIIGNNYNNGTRNHIYRYSYRGDSYLDEQERIEIHRGLWKKFSLKHELKYEKKKKEVVEEVVFSTLADRLRDFN
ncbi:hypothetical protein D3M61_07755 [Aliarcobacter butzleri]|uniref:P-loop ATPase, Sll1717 family n=1 Tax=Aliarcobacter butzleri TaxID=28197 RepID=UPI00102DCC8D|nr:hypothetical protein [Aliarcobacter butzleri]RZV13394.1 hypothetical protein D3M61_07755 [Aliarcobacter butzleri]